ncbi:hypothetical protein DFH09DRAFT_1271400 [Mycena vulgaris]|nr:hypothetical protein DFH09DRAFT_1271400 [Mycena vulgaris]
MNRRVPLLVGARNRIRLFSTNFRHLQPTAQDRATCHDVLWTSLTALRTSSDAFPPLKGVVGAVTSVLEVSQRVRHSKKDAHELADRAVRILDILADEISDPTAIPEPMLASIRRFQQTLEEIQEEMSHLATRGRIWRLRHLNQSEGALRNFNRRLDDASREFTIGSAVRGEVTTHRVQTQISDVSVVSLVHHKKQMLFLRGIILLQALFFWPSPVLAA